MAGPHVRSMQLSVAAGLVIPPCPLRVCLKALRCEEPYSPCQQPQVRGGSANRVHGGHLVRSFSDQTSSRAAQSSSCCLHTPCFSSAARHQRASRQPTLRVGLCYCSTQSVAWGAEANSRLLSMRVQAQPTLSQHQLPATTPAVLNSLCGPIM